MAGMKTISEQVYEILYEGIISGQIAAGSKLTLKTIQNNLGVSSSPIREALTRLTEDGLISYQPNVGMTVIRFTAKDAYDIFSLAEEFDVIALKYAWKSAHHDDMIQSLSHVQEMTVRAMQSGHMDEWLKFSDEFHNVLIRYSDNSRLEEAVEKNRKQLSILSRRYQQDELNINDITKEHGEILSALEAGDITLAEQLMRAHIQASSRRSQALFDQ